MRQAVTTVQYVFAGIGGFMGWFLGGLDGFLYALLMFVGHRLCHRAYGSIRTEKGIQRGWFLKASAKGGNLLSGRYRPCA